MKRILFALFLLLASICNAGQSTSFIFTPGCGWPYSLQTSWGLGTGVAGEMYCHGFSPCTGITNATQIAWLQAGNSSNNPTHIGIAYYDDTGAAVVRAKQSYNAESAPTAGYNVHVMTSSDFLGGVTQFTLLAGHYYYSCYCIAEATSNSGGTIMSSPSINLSTFQIFTASARDGNTDSSHRCNTSDGSPPTTMGSLTSQTFLHYQVNKLGTNTP